MCGDGEDIPADMYYGCVDPPECTFNFDGDGRYGESNDGVGGGEVDLAAEIFVGRASVENATDVTSTEQVLIDARRQGLGGKSMVFFDISISLFKELLLFVEFVLHFLKEINGYLVGL